MVTILPEHASPQWCVSPHWEFTVMVAETWPSIKINGVFTLFCEVAATRVWRAQWTCAGCLAALMPYALLPGLSGFLSPSH